MSDLIARLHITASSAGMAGVPPVWIRDVREAIAALEEAAAALRQMEADLRSTQILLKLENERAFAAERELAELRAQQPPREPTPAMFIAGTKALAEAEGSYARHVWYAMYDAAPPAQQPKAE